MADYVRLIWRHRELTKIAQRRIADTDGWITPTAALQPVTVSDFNDLQRAGEACLLYHPELAAGNLFGQCAVSLPIHYRGPNLPVGLQIAYAPGQVEQLLAMSWAVEKPLGQPPPVLMGSCR